ncbi:MAG TPA: acyl-CoA thioesterase [Anaeromyxobacteraceae bacterium]|nr:acyl-CoA thioesterase [Anaeromyxobacteraceae bacterium]
MRPEETTREKLLPLSRDLDLRRRFMVLNEPIPGNLRFGMLLEELDWFAFETAIAYARRTHAEPRVVTAALDEIVVRRVADVTRDVRFLARINYVGRTSMEVGIRVESAPGGEHLASCYFTMVARDGDGPDARNLPVPPLEIEGDLAKLRAAHAEERRALRRREEAVAEEPPTAGEFRVLQELHRAQAEPGFGGALTRTLVAENWERTYPEQENRSRVVFGGYIMRRAFELSAICAEKVATHRAVLAAVNRINFFHPVQIGDKLNVTSRVVYAEGPAICVEAEIHRESRDRTRRALSNSCLFTFLNVDPALAPRDVPAVYPADWQEDARWLAARRNLASLHARTHHGFFAQGG